MLLRKTVYDHNLKEYLEQINDQNIVITVKEVKTSEESPKFKFLLDSDSLKLRVKSVGYSGYVNEDIKIYSLRSIKDTVESLQKEFPNLVFKVNIKPLINDNLQIYLEQYQKKKNCYSGSFYQQLLEMGNTKTDLPKYKNK